MSDSTHTAWALSQRNETDIVLHPFLAERMSEDKALAWMTENGNYPSLPPSETPEILETRLEPT